MRRCMHDKARTGGMTVYRRRAPSLNDESAEVLDLALDCVRRGVTTVAPTPTIVIDQGEVLRQLFGQRTGHHPVAGRPAHHDDRRAFTELLESYAGAVARGYSVHDLSFRRSLVRR